jgi:beta-aspartyl-peptidase (threonine type)
LPKLAELLKSYPKFIQMDTVGAVAVDCDGNLAAATSTGGLSLKIPGRIGDSPIIGCGNYADNEKGACSATGLGEIAIRLVLAKSTCDLISLGQTPQNATEKTISEVNRRIGNPGNQMGLIAIDSQGRLGVSHNSSHLCWAYMTPDSPSSEAFLTAKHIPRNQE